MKEEAVKRTEYDGYLLPNGWTMKRERGKTPNGHSINSCWVLRDEKGNWIDVDRYRHDLAERYNLDLSAEGVLRPSEFGSLPLRPDESQS